MLASNGRLLIIGLCHDNIGLWLLCIPENVRYASAAANICLRGARQGELPALTVDLAHLNSVLNFVDTAQNLLPSCASLLCQSKILELDEQNLSENAKLTILSTTSWGVLSGRAALSERNVCAISVAET